MISRGPLLALAFIVSAASTSPRCARGQIAVDTVRQHLIGLYRSIAQGDTATLRPRLADDLVWIVGATGATIGKVQLLAAAGTVQSPAPRFESKRLAAEVGARPVEKAYITHR